MPNLRCKPLSSGYTPPQRSGTNIAGPMDWTIIDEASVDGDILRIDINSLPTTAAGYKITSFEVALADQNGVLSIENLPGGPATGYVRRLQAATPQNTQRVQVRSVQQCLNQITWISQGNPAHVPQPGDLVVQAQTGSQATVRVAVSSGSSNSYYVVLENISGNFTDETATTVAGHAGVQESPLHCTHIDAERQILRSDWSLPRDVTPAPGAATVTLTASRTTCLQGQAIVLEAAASGFQATRPYHDLHFHFRVDKPGEQGTHAALPDWFDTCFGSGANNRAEGYSPIWSFVPRTTGTVTVTCEVRDGAGNVATGTLDLTVVPVLTQFAASEIHAISASGTAVPGISGAHAHSSLSAFVSSVPTGQRALILLDTADQHEANSFAQFNFDSMFATRLVIMPYNAAGVGVAAGARATLNGSLKYDGSELITFGVDYIGPYDPADPFSVSVYPGDGFVIEHVRHASIAECRNTGWRTALSLPAGDNTGAYVDLYVTDYQNFGLFGGDVGRHAVSGSYVFTNPRSWRAAGKSSASDNATVGFFVDHGPYRSSRPEAPRGMSKSVFFSCCSWGGTGYPQPPVRWYGSGNTPRPIISYNSEIISEGAALTVDATTRGGGNTTAHPQEFVLDKFYHLTTMQPTSAISIGFGGVTIRNGILATGETRYEVNASGVRAHIDLSNQNPVPGQNDNENNPVIVEFLTIADLRNDAGQGAKALAVMSNSADYPMKNVSIREADTFLTYAPNFSQADTDAEPLNATARWTPLYAGNYAWNATTPTVAAQTPDVSLATPPETTASFEPGPGSSAYQTASGPVPYHDIRSRVRPAGAASRGAYDPGAV